MGIGAALIVLWSASAAWMLHKVNRSMGQALDRRLAMSAEMVAGLVDHLGLANKADSAFIATPITIPRRQAVACQIRSLHGEIFATSAGAPSDVLSGGTPGYGTTTAGGETWRVYTLLKDGLVISTADRMIEREAMARRVAFSAKLAFATACAGGLALLWCGLRQGLEPLRRMGQHIERRGSAQPTVLPTAAMPTELVGLAHALNDSFQRDARAFERERAFTGAAAHELRTPLTVLDTHLQVARLNAGPQACEALDDALQGATRMRGIIDDLLLLARLDAEEPLVPDATPISLRTLLNQALQNSVAHKRLHVRMPEDRSMLPVPGRGALWAVALSNLVDNALRYTSGAVILTVDKAGTQLEIAVRDQGSGMDPTLALRRFWRGDAQEGNGLGLPLAQAIAERLGGRLTISSSEAGTVCTLQLPPCEPFGSI